MKKLMFMLAAIATAAAVQAASVTWQSGVVFGPSDADGKLTPSGTYKLADTSTASMYLWLVADATEYAKVQSDGVYATYGEKLGTADATTSTLSSSKFADLTTTGNAASENVYAAILITYKDGDGKDWYLENTATTKINDMGGNGSVQGLARYQGGSGGTQIASWGSASVPEPTSGLLMLVGLAGLALRRRRA